MIAGVGGQGVSLISKILGECLLIQNHDVKISEIHGIAQRGSSVVTHVRYGDRIWSPVIEKGEADIIISLELFESYRWLPYLKPSGVLLSSNQLINPMPVIMGQTKYSENIILDKIYTCETNVIIVPVVEFIKQVGIVKVANAVMIGVAAQLIDVDKQIFYDVIRSIVPQKMVNENIKAFDLGYNFFIIA